LLPRLTHVALTDLKAWDSASDGMPSIVPLQ
jgi:hypothetical protein